jgi:hypothetical protein
MLFLGFLVLMLVVYIFGFLHIVKKNNEGDASPISSSSDHLDSLAAQHLGAEDHGHEQAPVPEDQLINKPSGVTIGWAVTITGCGSDPITEGAAVLKHSIHLTSVHGDMGGRYDYKMYAIYHPDGEKCAKSLESLGYTLIKRDTPVAVKDIQGEYLRSKIHDNGCCGEKELVKLEAYTLTDHPVVVHMDLDTVVLKPLDSLFDWMLVDETKLKSEYDTSHIALQWPNAEKPKKVNAFFTRDCKIILL